MSVADEPIRRERERALVVEAFARAADGGRELVLIEGDLGAGKSGVLDALDGKTGLLVRGGFDDLERPTPYGALLVGLRRLVHGLLTESDVRLAQWRAELHAGLGVNAPILVEEVPELAHVIGKQPPAPALAPMQARARLRLALEAFVDVACQPGRPLAIVLDDLHKADDASLALVGDLAIDDSRANLLIACAYRADMRERVLPLIARVEERTAPVRIELGAIDREALARDFARRFEVDDASDLADIVHAKTGGKPYAVRQFLRSMIDSGAIAFHRGWAWDEARLRAAKVTDDVATLIGAQLARLPVETRRLVATAACVGERFALTELARVAERSPGDLLHDLDDAVVAGIVTHAGGGYRFAHDRIRSAARDALPARDQQRIHLALARRLIESHREERLFDIADHLNAGAGLLDDHGERAALNAEAGRRARAAGAHAQARTYLHAAIDAGEPGLYLECAEAELLAGDAAASDALLDLALASAATTPDRVAVHRQRLWQDSSRGLGERAIETGMQALALLEIVPSTGERELRARLERVEALLATRSIDTLVELREVRDPRVRAAMDVLDALQPSAYNFAQPLYAYVTLALVELSLRHGNSPASVSGYGGMFLVLWQMRGDAAAFRTADELARVSVKLAEKYGNDSQRSRAMIRLGACITGWVAPASDTLAVLDEGYRIGLAAGELPGAGLNLQYRAINAHFVGTSLSALDDELVRDLRFARKNGLRLVEAMMHGLRRVVATLTADGPGEPATFVAPAQEVVHDIYLAEALLVRGDAAGALALLDGAGDRLGEVGALLVNATYAATCSLALLQLGRGDDPRIAVNQGRLLAWSSGCRDNFEHLYLVVEAECARSRGDRLVAIDAYDAAITGAARGGFDHHEAIACELAGRFWHAHRHTQIAVTYLERALQCYRRWGATRAVERLSRAFMLAEPAAVSSLASFVDASQAISQEVELDSLLARVLEVVVAQTGAERGAVVVRDAGELVAYTPRPTPLEAAAPASLVRYALRTGKQVAIDDAATDAAFGRDADVQRRNARSMLAVPMAARGTVRGVIFVEHTGRRAFDAERRHVADMLASQAAISLDNATAYRNLSASNRELERALAQVEDAARLRKELEIGARIQTSILPAELVVPGLDLAAVMLTASEVGGDYYDVLPTRDGAWIGIGDVAGHGLNAGIIMLMAQSAIAALARQHPDARPSEIICAANELLYENVRRRLRRDEHITLSLVRYHAGRIEFAGAHEDILIVRATGACEWIPTPGTWLAARRDIADVTVDGNTTLAAGDVLVLYTDGVIEAANAKREEFGSARLAEVVSANHRETAETIRDRIVAAVEQWAPVRDDDITVLVAVAQ